MQSGLRAFAVAAATLLAAAPAAAQVLTLEAQIAGDLQEADVQAFRDTFEAGLDRAVPGGVLGGGETRNAIGDLAECGDPECAAEIGGIYAASVAVDAYVYAEAEIYDFTVTVYDLNDGAVLIEQTGDCTFCPLAEALEAFGFTAEAALSSVVPLPTATSGPVAAVEPRPEPEPESAYVEGDIQFSVSVVPSTATIVVNGAPVGEPGSVTLMLAPQDLVVTASADGYEAYTESVSLRESMTGPIFVRVVLSADVGEVVVRQPRQRRERSPTDFNRRAVGGVLFGSGLAATAGGIVLLLVDGESTCPSGPLSLCREIYETTAGGVVMTALGGIAAGTGFGLMIGQPASTDVATSVEPRGRVGLAPLRGGAALSFERRF